MLDLGRREFISLLGGAPAWPVAGRAPGPCIALNLLLQNRQEKLALTE
jgi:hypothetical protein